MVAHEDHPAPQASLPSAGESGWEVSCCPCDSRALAPSTRPSAPTAVTPSSCKSMSAQTLPCHEFLPALL